MKKETITVEKKFSIKIDKRLDKYNNVVLFPQKVEEAKKDIEKYGLPEAAKKKR